MVLLSWLSKGGLPNFKGVVLFPDWLVMQPRMQLYLGSVLGAWDDRQGAQYSHLKCKLGSNCMFSEVSQQCIGGSVEHHTLAGQPY